MGLRQYCFSCDSCSYKFDLSVDSEIIIGFKTKCPHCSSKKCYRDYFSENVRGNEGPKTLGMLADLNAKKQRKGIYE